MVSLDKSNRMAGTRERRLLVLKRPEGQCSLQPVETHDSIKDPVNKLDKQVAELKRKQMSAKQNSSPRNRLNNIYTVLNNMQSKPVADSLNFVDLTTEPHYGSNKSMVNLSPNSSKITKRRSNKSQVSSVSDSILKVAPTPLTIPSVDSNNYHSNLNAKEGAIKRSSNSKTTENSPPNEISTDGNIPVLRPMKAAAVNMFDSIPDSNTAEIDISVEVPDSSQSQNGKTENGIGNTRKENSINKVENDREASTAKHNEHLFSSPVKITRQKKQVAFSSDIESSSFTSSPIKEKSNQPQIPKSILKSKESVDSLPAVSIEELLKRDLSKNDSWPPGFVLQIPDEYPDVQKVVYKCVCGLSDKQFTKQYEVYATLNHLIKRNNKITTNPNIFTKEIVKNIVLSIKNDLNILVSDLKNGSNAFKLRTSSQGIKLLSLLNQLTNEIEELPVVYDLCIKILKNENISKSLASSFFQLIKIMPESLSDKVEGIITSLIQMKYFLSATVTCEKLNILKRFILLHPKIASKCNYQILSHVFYSILNTDVPSYNRILFSSISVLTVLARNDESKFVITKILSEELEDSSSFIKSSSGTELLPWMTISQAICETLKYLIHLQLYPQAAKIWAYLLYMVSYNKKNFIIENWNMYTYFQSVFTQLYTIPQGLPLALEAWKSIIYNFQMVSVKEWSDEQLKNKLDSILSPFENIQLKMNDSTYLIQWTEYEGYIVLYCRIFYAIRLKMENSNESQNCLLIKAILKPLCHLKEWDEHLEYILQVLFTSDRYVYNEVAETCFWLSDYEKWRSRILPLPKGIFKNAKNFSVILETVKKMSTRSIEFVSNMLNLLVYIPLENLKLSVQFSDYRKIADISIDLIGYIFDVHFEMIENGGEQEAKLLFNIIENADEDLLFLSGGVSLMTILFNKFRVCRRSEFIVSFIILCRMKFDQMKLFSSCLLSNVYENGELLLDDNVNNLFPHFLHYPIDLRKVSLSENDKAKLVENLNCCFEVFISTEHGCKRYDSLVVFIENSKINDILSKELRYVLFLNLLQCYNNVLTSTYRFYEVTPVLFLHHALEKFDNDDRDHDISIGTEFVKFLKGLPKIETIPDDWILEIGPKLECLVYSDMEFDNKAIGVLRLIESRLPMRFVSKIKKLAIRRKVHDFPFLRNVLGQEIVDVEGSNDELEGDVGNDTLNLDEIEETAEDQEEKGGGEKEKEREEEEISDVLSTQVISTSIEDCDISFVQTDEEDTSMIISSQEGQIVVSDKDQEATPVGDLKSFIIDSIQIQGSVDEKSVRLPSSTEVLSNDDLGEAFPARRTRSYTRRVEMEILNHEDEDSFRKRQKRKEKKERKGKEKQKADIVDTRADMDQFRTLLRKLSEVPLIIENGDKQELETELITLLMKLKKG